MGMRELRDRLFCDACNASIEIHFHETPVPEDGTPPMQARPSIASFRHPLEPASCALAGARLVVCQGRDHGLVEATNELFPREVLDVAFLRAPPVRRRRKPGMIAVLPALVKNLFLDHAAADLFRVSAAERRRLYLQDWALWTLGNPPAPPDTSILGLRDDLAYTVALVGENPALRPRVVRGPGAGAASP